MSLLSNLLFYLVGMWLQKLILISDLTRAFIDIIGCGSAIQANLIAFALHDDSARPCKI